MCIACKTYGRNRIVNEKQLKDALQALKELYNQADEETLMHLDALTNRWIVGKGGDRLVSNPDIDEEWERSHR